MGGHSVDQFSNDMKQIVSLLEQNKEQEARLIFNREIYEKYSDIRGSNVENPLSRVILFFYDLDEYLNSPNARFLGVASRANIIASFYSDYQADLKTALAQEQKERTQTQREFESL